MEFDLTKHSESFKNAFAPFELKDQWQKIDSYVYIVQKKFRPVPNAEELNLMKIGMGRIRTNDTGSRIGELQTALISLNVYRIYLYFPYDMETGKNSEIRGAYALHAEQQLHKYVEKHYEPNKVRMFFPSGNPAEWFDIKESQIKSFLEFCDKTIFYDIVPRPMYGTQFTKNKGSKIVMKGLDKMPPITGFAIIEGKVKRRGKGRKAINNKLAESNRQKKSITAFIQREKEDKAFKKKERQRLKKNVPFWKEVFNDKLKPFRDKDLSKRFQLKFTDVEKMNQIMGSRPQIVVIYEPVFKPTRTKKELTDQEIYDNSGFLTINEALDAYPELKNKHKESYEFYKKYNAYEEGMDYASRQ